MVEKATAGASSPEPESRGGPGKAIELRVTAGLIDAFADLSGDRSSLHVDDAFAGTSRYRRRVAHGMLPVSLLAGVPGIVAAGYHARLGSIAGKFTLPTFVDDELRLEVEPDPDAQADPTRGRAFVFRIIRTGDGAEVTSGSFTLIDEPARRAAPGDSDGGRAGLPTEALEESRLDAETLVRGSVEEFGFVVSKAALDQFRHLLASAIGTDVIASDGLLDPEELLGLTQLSTLTGMRVPGRLATFMNFAADFPLPVSPGEHYRLVGTIAHVSRGTGLVRTKIEAVDAAGDAPMSGTVTALVNPTTGGRKSMADLEASATSLGLDGKVVIVTGATGGIGETIAKLFALLGARVVVNYRSAASDADRIVGEIAAAGGQALAVQADVSDEAAVTAMIEAVIERFGGVDVLVNNAVRNFDAIACEDLRWEDIGRDLDVTLKGAFLCARAALPSMRARGGGKIVNVSSVYAADPPKDQLKYVVSKAALEGLSRGLAAELAGANIQVNSVVPSFVDTETESLMHEGVQRRKARAAPMGRNASPEEVAQAVVFLASAFSAYTTGQRLLVTGGGAPYL